MTPVSQVKESNQKASYQPLGEICEPHLKSKYAIDIFLFDNQQKSDIIESINQAILNEGGVKLNKSYINGLRCKRSNSAKPEWRRGK